jgi:hypothetical protein
MELTLSQAAVLRLSMSWTQTARVWIIRTLFIRHQRRVIWYLLSLPSALWGHGRIDEIKDSTSDNLRSFVKICRTVSKIFLSALH